MGWWWLDRHPTAKDRKEYEYAGVDRYLTWTHFTRLVLVENNSVVSAGGGSEREYGEVIKLKLSWNPGIVNLGALPVSRNQRNINYCASRIGALMIILEVTL